MKEWSIGTGCAYTKGVITCEGVSQNHFIRRKLYYVGSCIICRVVQEYNIIFLDVEIVGRIFLE